MLTQQYEISDRFRRQILVSYWLPTALFIIGICVVFISDYCLHHKMHPYIQVFLPLAVIALLGLIVSTILRTRKALRLAGFGIDVDATITKVKRLSRGSRNRMNLAFVLAGDEHEGVWTSRTERNLNVGDLVRILVDPKNPRCWEVRNVLFDDTSLGRDQPAKSLQLTVGPILFFFAVMIYSAGHGWM